MGSNTSFGLMAVVVAFIGFMMFGNTNLDPIYSIEDKKDGIVQIFNEQGTGTGFFIDNNLVVTNAHVVGDSDTIKIRGWKSDKLYDAIVLERDEIADVALVELVEWPIYANEIGYEILTFEEYSKTGDTVYSYGHPGGFHSWTLSKGVITNNNRFNLDVSPMTYIQTDAEIHPGNSGGPLFNTHGEVIGINTLYFPISEAGYALRADSVEKSIHDLMIHGKTKWGRLGIVIEGLKNVHPTVVDVDPLGPAANAGMEPGDYILYVAGKKVHHTSDVQSIVLMQEPFTEIPVVVERAGEILILNVTLQNKTFSVSEFERETPIPPKPEEDFPPPDEGAPE